MSAASSALLEHVQHPVQVDVEPALSGRNRLTVAFRVVLAIPHILLVGGPAGAIWIVSNRPHDGMNVDWTAGGGVLGAVALVCALISWFAIVFTGRHPSGLRQLAEFYLRWRVRGTTYTALLRDEYPPFGDALYPATLAIAQPPAERSRLTVAFRPILVIPQAICVWALGLAWALTSVIAWVAILLTGSYPESLYRFGVGVLRWTTRVEAYMLLLHDDYPPFSLHD